MAKSRVSSIPIALLLLSLLLASFLAFARAEEAGGDVGDEAVVGESAVLALDVSNFSEVVAKHSVIVVEFYAPWCGHCKKLAPEYEKAALILSTHDPPIGLAKIDASEEKNKELAKKYDVQGFPTIKIIKNQGNDVQDYNGPREADGIVNYLKKQVGPVSTEIKSEEDAGNLIDEKTIFIVGVFPEYSGKEFENFMAVAEILRTEYDFGHTLDAKFLPRGDLTVKGPLVRLFKPFDELFVDFQDFDVDALKNSIEAATVPMVVTFDNDPSNHPYLIKFFTTAAAKAMLFLNFDNETFETFKSKIQEAAGLYKGKNISFLIGDRDASRGALEYFGVKDDQVPLIIIQENDGQKYLKPNLEPVEIASWLKEYMDGTLTLYRKSEPIPEDNDKPVKVVVADNLHDVVFNSGKNVLLDFYAPWCRICKELEPILEEVAASFKNDDDVVIAKMDATANDIPKEFNLQGYPTLYFNSASGKLLTFDGNKTAEAIIDFVQKNKDAATLSESIKDEL